ncbi:MAG: sugar-transfer associated ATP-grasp domain-containing protein [Betaproteobacteria bacterium]
MERLVERLGEYRTWMSLVRERTGKGHFNQIKDILALKTKGGRCGISDYYWYGLYRNDLKGRGAEDFLGWRLKEEFNRALNPRIAVLPAWDKVVFLVLASAAGLPVVPVRACFHRSATIYPGLGKHLRDIEASAGFLRDPSIYPLFGKPAYSQQGFGSVSMTGYDPDTDRISHLDGSTLSVPDFTIRLERTVDARFHRPECGYLFQDAISAASEIQALTGWPAISGVRVVCLNSPEEGVRLIRAIWKIAVPPNHIDNFDFGANGNMLANIDLTSGEISRVIGQRWPKARYLREHPITGKLLEGFHLPGWDRILNACRDGGAVFPLMRIQHWDFALTEQGPLILELNDIGGTIFLQLHGRGLLTEKTRAFLKRHADRIAHPWVASL